MVVVMAVAVVEGFADSEVEEAGERGECGLEEVEGDEVSVKRGGGCCGMVCSWVVEEGG